jgi:hypothetical protein
MLDPKKETPPEHQKAGGEIREAMEAPEEHSGGSSRRLVLLVLLLLVASGAGLYSRYGGAEPAGDAAPPVRQAVVSQPISMPVPAPPAPGERAEGAVKEKTTGAKEAEAVVPSNPPVESPPPAPAVAAKTVPAPVELPKEAFTLQTDPLLLPGELAKAERTLRTLGFEPSRATVPQTVTLTRLRLGVYPSAEALLHLREAQALIPDAFPLRQGGNVAIYAGSFHDVDRARIFADELYERGIRVEEEKAQVSLNVNVLRFGSFAGEKDAAKALESVRTAGLQSRLVRLP